MNDPAMMAAANEAFGKMNDEQRRQMQEQMSRFTPEQIAQMQATVNGMSPEQRAQHEHNRSVHYAHMLAGSIYAQPFSEGSGAAAGRHRGPLVGGVRGPDRIGLIDPA